MLRSFLVRGVTLLAVGVLQTGCLPLEPSFDRTELIMIGREHQFPSTSHAEAEALAAGWYKKLDEAASDRKAAVVVAEEILFWGTLGLAAGTNSSDVLLKRNAKNLAVASTVFTAHYKPGTQEQVFRRGAIRMKCLNESLSEINEARYRVVTVDHQKKLSAALEDKYRSAPRETVHYIERMRSEMRAALEKINLTTPTVQQLSATLKQYEKETSDAAGPSMFTKAVGARSLNTEEEAEDDAFITSLNRFSTSLTLCEQQNPI